MFFINIVKQVPLLMRILVCKEKAQKEEHKKVKQTITLFHQNR